MANLQNEILKIRQLIDQNADKDMKPILKAYKSTLDKVRLEITKLYGKYGDNLEKMSSSDRLKVFKNMEKLLIDQAKELNLVETAETTKIITESYKETYYRSFFIIQKGVEAETPFTVLSPKFVDSVVNAKFKGELFSDRIWANKKLLVNQLNKVIKNGIIQGASIPKMSKNIKDTLGVGAGQSKRLIRTETARVYSEASAKLYKDSPVVKKVMYDATLDNKTSEICQSLDGKIFDADSNYPRPPQHPNCRSAIIPIVNDWKPTKKRDNTGDKEIINYSSYENWSKSRGIT